MKKFIPPILIALVYLGLFIWLPEAALRSSKVTLDYFKEMAFILPPVFLLMGLMEVWLPKDKIQSWLGNDSGLRGSILSVALGTLPTGPVYVAFPIAASLLKKGASVANVVLFLGSWAALKIPQLMVEVKFLGWSFAALRFVLTLLALVLMGTLMKAVLSRFPDKAWQKQNQEKPE